MQQGSYSAPALAYATVVAPGRAGETPELTLARTVVTKIRPGEMKAVGGYVRVTVRGPSAGSCTLSALYIGTALRTVGNAWQFENPVAITWNGGEASRTIEADELAQSDDIAFTLDGSIAPVLAADIAAGSRLPFAHGLGDGFVAFWKDFANPADVEAASTAKAAGYDPFPGFAFGFELLEGAP